jgi:hypothetical protein
LLFVQANVSVALADFQTYAALFGFSLNAGSTAHDDESDIFGRRVGF